MKTLKKIMCVVIGALVAYLAISAVKVLIQKGKESGEREEVRRTVEGFYDIDSTVGSMLWARYRLSNKVILRMWDVDYGVVCYIAEAQLSYYSLSCVKIHETTNNQGE